MTKEEAISFLLKVLKSSVSMTSKPTKEKAYEVAKEHNITATDLLNKLEEIIWKV